MTDSKSDGNTVFCDEKMIKKCEYGADISGGVFCNYLEIEGHRRPCPPDQCTCFKKKTGRRRRKMSDLISRIPERDCDTCKHYVVTNNNGEEIKACECWECKYENRGDEELWH